MEECRSDTANQNIYVSTERTNGSNNRNKSEDNYKECPNDGVDESLLVIGDNPTYEDNQKTEDCAKNLKGGDGGKTGRKDVSGKCSKL